MYDRILHIDLDRVLEMFENSKKYKYFEVNEDENQVRVEIPHGDHNLVVFLEYSNRINELPDLKDRLIKAGFMEQEIKMSRIF